MDLRYNICSQKSPLTGQSRPYGIGVLSLYLFMKTQVGLYSLFLAVFVLTLSFSSRPHTPEKYVCLPCGEECDHAEYDSPGTCGHCQMPLVKKSTVVFGSIAPEDICKYIEKHPNAILLDVR